VLVLQVGTKPVQSGAIVERRPRDFAVAVTEPQEIHDVHDGIEHLAGNLLDDQMVDFPDFSTNTVVEGAPSTPSLETIRGCGRDTPAELMFAVEAGPRRGRPWRSGYFLAFRSAQALVIALLRCWRVGRHGRGGNGNRQGYRECIPHVHTSGVTDNKEVSTGSGSSGIANLPHATEPDWNDNFPFAMSLKRKRFMLQNYARD
jgi:hypothetical protein